MSYQVLARKWRPRRFEELVGQQHVIQALTNGLDNDRVHHAFLFTGTRGVGKTTLARILAKCLNCERGVTSQPCGECSACVDIDAGRFVDMMEIDAASRTKVDDTRELLDSVQYTPTRGRFKIYIIDEVHMLSNSSFNALLKTLEEPPPHVKFVLATTDPERIPVTILSRCLQFNLRRLLPDQIREQLSNILNEEGIDAEEDALVRLARAADGSMRDGLSLLDQAIAFGGGAVAAANVDRMLGLVDRGHVVDLIEAVADGRAEAVMELVAELVSQSRDLDAVLVSLAETLHRVCLIHCVPDYRDDERSDWEAIEKLSRRVGPEDAQLFYQVAIKGRQDLGIAPDPRTGLEMTLLRMIAFRPLAPEASAPSGGVGTSVPAGGSAREAVAAEAVGRSARPPDSGRRAAGSSVRQTRPETSSGEDRGSPAASEQDWVALSSRLKLKGPVRELARNVQLSSCSGDRWEFVIAPSLRHLGSESCVDRLSRAISAEVGHPVRVSLVDSGEQSLTTVAALEAQQRRTKMTDAERAIDGDPTVRALREEMGATILKDSIQPLQ